MSFFVSTKTKSVMKKLTATAAAALLLTLSAFNEASTWKSEKFHQELGFSITHMGISDVRGEFKNFEADLKASKPDFSDAVFTMHAEVASIDTDVEPRDEHLRSADFFDAAKHPQLTFKSTGIKPQGKDRYKLTGNLTIRGVSKPVVLDLWYRGTVANPIDKQSAAGFKVTGVIKRSDFGIGKQFPAPMLSDEVKISADGEFVKE